MVFATIRFYFISCSDSVNIRRLLAEILEAHPIAYYSTIYERHVNFLSRLRSCEGFHGVQESFVA